MGIFNFLGKKCLLPKIIIAFECNGCMATQHDFQFVGYVVKEWKSEAGVDMYDVQVIKKAGGAELRNGYDKIETAWQIQHLFGNLYCFYG